MEVLRRAVGELRARGKYESLLVGLANDFPRLPRFKHLDENCTDAEFVELFVYLVEVGSKALRERLRALRRDFPVVYALMVGPEEKQLIRDVVGLVSEFETEMSNTTPTNTPNGSERG